VSLDILKGTLRRIVHRAGAASVLEPTLRRLPGLQAGVTAPAGSGDIGRLQGGGGHAHGDRDGYVRCGCVGHTPSGSFHQGYCCND
jgi:hypothetical protein